MRLLSCNYPGEFIPRTETYILTNLTLFVRLHFSYIQQLLLMRCLFVFPLLLGHFIIGKLPNDNPCLPLATGGLIYVVFSDTYFFWNKILIKLKIPLRSHNFYFSSLFTHSSWFTKPSLGRNKIMRWYRLTHGTSSVNASWWHFRFWEANKETRVIIWVSQLFSSMKFFLCKIFLFIFP